MRSEALMATIDRQANAPAEDTARMRDHRVCDTASAFLAVRSTTDGVHARPPWVAAGQIGGLQARLVTLFLIHCSDARTENSLKLLRVNFDAPFCVVL